MLLAARSVAHFYGPKLVFKDVTLEVPPASVTILAGPNGAGKSTLLRIMAGLTRPAAGSVDIGTTSRGIEAGMAYLGHQTFLYPDLTALDNLRFWAGLYRKKLSPAAFEALLERVELASFGEEKTRGFSRGMAQRLNLARVFLLEADILLLDEPGTGLDARSTAILHQEIAAAKARGAGVVWITHSPEDDARRADAVARLERGRLRFEDAADAARVVPAPALDREARGGQLC